MMSTTRLCFLDPLSARLKPADGAQISLDLRYGRLNGILSNGQIRTHGDELLPWPGSELLDADDRRTILIWRENGWEKWQHFDGKTRKFYKMVFVASGRPPTVEISGIKMHVTEDSHPQEDTRRKLLHLQKMRGNALDTCCGLGYTAIALSELPGIADVITYEIDPNMQQLCRENPWSSALYENPHIRIKMGDAARLIKDEADGRFAAIIHDPPRFALAPELYGEKFYAELSRILYKKGRLYHYTGDPNRQTRKVSLPQRTLERLHAVGFRNVKFAHQGVAAVK